MNVSTSRDEALDANPIFTTTAVGAPDLEADAEWFIPELCFVLFFVARRGHLPRAQLGHSPVNELCPVDVNMFDVRRCPLSPSSYFRKFTESPRQGVKLPSPGVVFLTDEEGTRMSVRGGPPGGLAAFCCKGCSKIAVNGAARSAAQLHSAPQCL